MSDTFDVTITRSDLSKILEFARGAFSNKSPQEILKCYLLDASNGKLTASGTDNFVSATSSADATIKTPGRVCVDARSFADIAKDLPEGDVRLTVTKDAFQITAKKSKRKLATSYAENFPVLPSLENATKLLTIEANVLARLLAQGSYAQATDDTRPHLAGALLEIANDLATVVSTDGSRLAKATARVTHGPAARLLVPPRGLTELRNVCGSAKGGTLDLYTQRNMLLVTSGDSLVSIQLGDSDGYPKYQKVIPNSHDRSVTVHRDSLMAAVKRAGLVSKALKGGGVRFEFTTSELAIKAEHESDAADERVECEPGFEFQVGVGAALVLQALSVLTGDEVTIEMGSELHPMVFTSPGDDEVYALCMPMRLA